MNRFWCPLFADWLERNNMNCFFRYSVKGLNWNIKYGTDVTSIFWASIGISMFMGFLLIRRISVSPLVVCSIVLILITNVFLMFTLSLTHVTLWLGAVGKALGLGSLPGYLLTVSMDFVSRSDLVSSLVLVCISIGKVTTSPLIGYLFQHVSYTWFISVSFIFALIMFIVCLILIVMMIYKARKTHKPLKEGLPGETQPYL